MERGGEKIILKPIRISKNFNEEKEAILLSPPTRMFHEPNYNVYIVAIMGWKVPIEVDAIKAEIQRKLLKHPRFSSLQVMDESAGRGEMRWVPTTVNIDDHIIVPQIADDKMDTDKLVEEYISNLSTTTIDMSKPLWDFHALNVKTSQAKATSISRIHHSLGDGVSLMSLLLSCFWTISDPSYLPTLPVSSSSKDKSNLSISNREDIWSSIWQYLVKLWLLVKLLFNTVVDVLLITTTTLFLKDSQSPFMVAHRSNRQRFIYRTVSFDDIKFVKSATNTAVAEMVEENATVIQGNCFGFAIIPLTLAQLKSPLDYVRKGKIAMDRKKHSLETGCTFYILQLILKFFGSRGATRLAERILSQTTLIFSNVAGPLEEVSLAGHPLTFLAPTCYGHPTGLMIHACSYAKKLTFVMAVDGEIIPNPNQLGDDFVGSFMHIKEAALSKLRTKVD
ncbi:wax ester synthase/diacylglycerol acyltransferase 5-like [Lycium barbarum]|uniref:wax ester synthase/diacylglycerol acyltransferase 5-like n=1 Tax=Lycium barbarum TaxID=112863 RepID=UPI00293EBFF8|nr:wax ester synthase/diacylglycerol acyltransferase 5-like [Lycium barbarum]